MKKILTLLMGFLLFQWISVEAQKVQVNGLFYNLNTSAKTAAVTYRDGYDTSSGNRTKPDNINYSETSIIIPATISVENEIYAVTSIDSYAFCNSINLETVKIDAPIVTISNYAFYGCSQMTSINIPDGVTSIPQYCFYKCSSLTELKLPAGVTEIGISAFYGCSQLASINIPDGVTKIPGSCFTGCSSLTELKLPSEVTEIGSDAFRGCSLLASINIPDGITTIPYECFYGCSSLTELTLPSGLTEIGSRAFYGCTQLATINIPAGVTKIPESCFYNCSSLTELKLPSGVTEIENNAFWGCGQLASINIPEGVTKIPNFCFHICSSLTELKLPEGVTEIGQNAFSNCSQLASINIPDGVTTIPYQCFSRCSLLTELVLPSGVTEIGVDAFSGCNQLTSINIPDGVTKIPMYCFYECSSLTQLVLPAGVTEIGNNPFYGCGKLEQLTCLNPNPPTLGSNVLPSPSTLKTVYVPFGAKAAYEAADGWKNYNIVELPGTLTGTLKVQDFAIDAAETKQVNLNFDGELNANLYSGFQFDIALPQGITVSQIDLNESLKAAGFNLRTTTSTDSSKIRVVCANTAGKTSGLTQGILTLTVTAAPNAPNGDAQISLSKIYFSSPKGEDIILEDSQSNVTINNIPVTGFTITPSEEEEIYVNQTVTFSATVTPDNATIKSFTWSLDDEEEGVVSVEKNENGEITVKGLKLGEATLTVTADDFQGETATVTVKVVPTPAQSVVVSAADLILLVGTTGELTATVSPEDTTYPTVTWTSDTEGVATVSEEGVVTAVSAGKAIITATCGDAKGTCEVTVKAIDDITVIPGSGATEGDEDQNPGENTEEGMAVVGSDLIIRVGQTGTVTLSIDPGVDYDPQLQWALDNGGDSYVTMTVDDDNSLKATFEGLAVGETTYTVSTPANEQEVLSGRITVIATNPVMSLSLEPGQLSLAQNAPAYPLTATITPDEVTTPTLNWTSSDTGIATVDGEGNVTPVAMGSCDITVATTDGTGLTAVCHVTVTEPIDDNFDFEFDDSVMGGAGEISIYLDATYQFKPKAQDGYVLPDNITWSSSAPEVVSVDDDGTIHGLQLGEATITATATVNGEEVTATCLVKVIPIPAKSITIDGGGVESIKRKETLELTARVLPSDTTFPEVTWESSSEATATVSRTGVVTGQNAGNVTITAYVTKYPDVKATYELEITDLLLGDSNDNGIVTVADVVTTADYILEIPVVSWSFVNADVTGDNNITTADVTATVDIILNDVDFLSLRRARAYMAEAVSDCLISDNYTSGEPEAVIGVRLDGTIPYSAMQATLCVPEGMKVTDITAGPRLSDHMVLFNEPAPGIVKLIIFSFYNTEFSADDAPLFYIVADTRAASGDLQMVDILGSDASSNEYELGFAGGANESGTTAVGSIAGNDIVIRSVADGIEVINAEGLDVCVYRYTGETVATLKAANPVERIRLESGAYIVKAANTAAKVLVK